MRSLLLQRAPVCLDAASAVPDNMASLDDDTKAKVVRQVRGCLRRGRDDGEQESRLLLLLVPPFSTCLASAHATGALSSGRL